MKKKILAAIAAGAMLLSTTPVFGADEEVLEFQIQEVSQEDILVPEDAEGNADRAASFTYYAQYAYQCNSDYDLIAAYVKGIDGKIKSRLFFVYDKLYGEWLRYDYSKMSAETFLTGYETKDSSGTTLYVPVVKQSGGKNVIHSNNPKTAIDESKIPLLLEADVKGINFAWKALSEIPFVKNGAAYEYAGEGSQKEEEPEPDPSYPGEDFFEINGNYYALKWSEEVPYNGKNHVWDQMKTNARQEADLAVTVIKDGLVLSSTEYSVTCRNNLNVGTGKNRPYFTVTLKGHHRQDNAKMSKRKFYFEITPYSVTRGILQAKKAIVQDDKVTLTDPCFIFEDGRKVKLTLYNSKTKTGTFSVAKTKDGIQITGYNNFSGSGLLSLSNSKRVTYEW